MDRVEQKSRQKISREFEFMNTMPTFIEYFNPLPANVEDMVSSE